MFQSSTISRPIGVGIVGLSASGGWAAGSHVPALRATDGYELRGLSASSAASADASGLKHGVPLTFASAAELATHEDIDLVVIAVKVPHHRELVMSALQAGKIVFCEWPLGNGLAESEELANAARAAGARTAVGLQARSAPAIRYLRDLVADGYVGEVLSSTIVASGFSWGGELPTASTRYSIDAANGATMLTIPVGHTLDAASFVLGELAEFQSMLATRRRQVLDIESGDLLPMTAADQVAVIGRLEGGAVMTVHFRGGLSRGTNLHWEINGSEGDIVISGPSGHVQLADLELRGGRGRDTGLSVLPVPASYQRVPATSTSARVANVANAYAQLVADLTDGTSVVPTFDHAVRRHRMIQALGPEGTAAAAAI
jgi:predicted dehydrogenase